MLIPNISYPMAVKKNSITHLEPDALVIPRLQFISALKERVTLGLALVVKAIENSDEFAKLEVDFARWDAWNSEYLKHQFNNENSVYRKKYDSINSLIGLRAALGAGTRDNSPHMKRENFRQDVQRKVSYLEELIELAEIMKSSSANQASQNLPSNQRKAEKNNNVFIVHGHDELARTQTARFIEKIGLTPIILHEQSSAGGTIIEKIERYSDVGFGIVLYTPCDKGFVNGHEDEIRPRARQNVVFEHGYLIGKIGRENVCALVKGDVETPNDISGVVYIKHDDDGAWQLKLTKELKSSGFNIDLNKL